MLSQSEFHRSELADLNSGVVCIVAVGGGVDILNAMQSLAQFDGYDRSIEFSSIGKNKAPVARRWWWGSAPHLDDVLRE